MLRTSRLLATSLLGPIIALWSLSAHAVPSFATKIDKGCSACHNAWPQLNKKGREFKELGYRLPEELKGERSDSSYFEPGEFPISALLVARPYDERDSGEHKIRALHEVEVFIAGAVGRDFSAFMEIEAEDETGMEPEIPAATLSYNHSPAFNLNFVWAPAMFPDPYGFISGSYRLTRGTQAVANSGFGGANGNLAGTAQSVSVSGRPTPQLFYLAGVAGDAGDTEGEDGDNIFTRLAFDITPNFMVGLFGIKGEALAVAPDPARDFNRFGADLQMDIDRSRIQAAYVVAEDDNATATATEENTAWSVQAFHTFTTETGQPTWVPLVRYDRYEQADGDEEFTELTLNLSYYFKQNVKGYLEFWKQLDTPSTANSGFGEDNRITLQFYLGL